MAVPVEIASNHVYLPVRVNGSAPLWFLLDSGAGIPAALVDAGRAAELGLRAEGSTNAAAIGGQARVEFADGVRYSVAGVEIGPQRVGLMPLAEHAAEEGHAIDGILGHDFFSRFVVEIDYGARTVRLHDPGRYRYAGSGAVLPIEFEGKVPTTRGTARGDAGRAARGKFVVDTGHDELLVLSRRFAEGIGVRGLTARARHGAGLGGDTSSVAARLRELRVGPYRLAGSVVRVSLDQAGALAGDGVDGFIGGEYLRRFRVVFDYGRRQLVLEPGAAAAATR